MELDTLDERIKIRDAIQNGRIQEAISLVNSLHPELLDSDKYLYFHLQVKLLNTKFGTQVNGFCPKSNDFEKKIYIFMVCIYFVMWTALDLG